MAKRTGSAFVPSSPAMPPTTLGPTSYETPARGTSHPSPSPMFRSAGGPQVRASSPSESGTRTRLGGGTKAKPTPPPTPQGAYRESDCGQLGDQEEHELCLGLSPQSTSANFSTAEGSQYETSTIASEAASATNAMLLRAAEMIQGEVRQSEMRMVALFEKERETRELSCNQLRRDLEEMVTIVEALSIQVHTAPAADSRLDVFLEQEKRARDALREDVEALADEVQDQVKAASGCLSSEDISNLSNLTSIFEEERAARDAECAALRKNLEALSTLAAQERSGRDLSIAVLRKDLTNKINAAVTGDVRQRSEPPQRQPPPSPAFQISEARIYDLLEQQRREILEQQRIAVLDMHKDVEAVMRSLPSADASVKCTGGTGNSEDELGGNLVPLAEMQHQLLQCKDAGIKLQTLTGQLRLDLTSSTQTVNLRLEKVDQAINDLQFDIRSAQTAELTPRRSSIMAELPAAAMQCTGVALHMIGNLVCGRD